MLLRRVTFALLLAACGDDGSSTASTTQGPITSATAATAPATTTDTGGQSGTTQASVSDSMTLSSTPTEGATADTGDESSTQDSAPLLDIGTPETGFDSTDTDPTADGCTAVDLLFVIDNSVSMGDYQNALSLAFPGFADAIFETLPPGTNLHVGVTSTTMGYSSGGSTINCDATGDGMQPQDFFYETPDTDNNGLNGAQGRLYKPANGPSFYDIDTDASPAELDALKSWFADAAKIGEGGSQIEMSAAAAGWVADPANAATNAGFIRDEGAVLAIFLLQDEADQTPHTIDGKSGGLAMLDKLVAAKAGCGGATCIIGGGFANTNCLPEVALGELMNNLGAPSQLQELPDEDLAEDTPEVAAEQMNQLLRDTLTGIIKQKCDEIEPPL
jgi:hypothetical protein